MRCPCPLAPTALFLLLWGCSTKPHDLQSQLKENFKTHLTRKDSSTVLDSFRVVGVDTLTERFGRIIDDTIYSRQRDKILSLYQHATDKDSLAFYKYELDYMATEIDSIQRSIPTADTKKKYGLAVRAFFTIKKGSRSADNFVFYFLDRNGTVLDSELIDSVFIREAYMKIK